MPVPRSRRTPLLLASISLFLAGALAAQESAKAAKPAEEKPAAPSDPPREESSVTEHTIRINGQAILYKATAGTLILKSEKGEPTALFGYVAYSRSDVTDLSARPITFAYNGGPGSASLWLHMGALGPRRVLTADASPTPPAPYRLVDNQYSILDKTDIVMIDPVGTGFSHALGKAENKDFWGVDADITSISHFIKTYITRNNRWNSPKFLLGESYGTFRSAGVVNHLQDHDGMDFNGVVLVSSVLDLGTISFNPGQDLPYILYLPSYAATACYHTVLKDCPADLNGFLAEARAFAVSDYAAALAKGARLGAAEKTEVARKLARFTGLGEDYLVKANLRVRLSQYMQELQRSRGLATGRLDSRFSGPIYDLLSEGAEYDAQSAAITGAYTAAFNSYIREELKFGLDKEYNTSANFAGQDWDWKHRGGGGEGFVGSPNTENDLIQAMISNTHLRVQVENGIFDMATPFFGTEYTMDHLGLPEQAQNRIKLNYYNAGHMMYVHEEDLAKFKASVGSFIDSASKP